MENLEREKEQRELTPEERRKLRKMKRAAKPLRPGTGSFFAKLLCLVLGFIIGIVGTIGGVAGLGYYAVTQVPIKDAVDSLNDLAGLEIEYTDYINEEYGNGTTLNFILEVVDVVKGLSGDGNLAALDKISPLVGENVQKLIDKANEFGLSLDCQTIMNTPFSGIGEYFTNTINNVEIASLIETVTKNNVEGLLAAICYGEKGEQYILDDNGNPIFLGDASSITIGSLTNATALSERLTSLSFLTFMSAMGEVNASDPIIRTLVYGIEGEDYVLNSDGSVTQLPKTYDLNTANNEFADHDGKIFTAIENNAWANESGNKVVLREDVATYKYDVVDADGNLIYNLKHLETVEGVERYQAYIDDVAQLRKGFYISDILGGDQAALITNIPLAAFLSLESPIIEDAEPLLVILAYGEENTHWERYTDTDGNEAWRFLKDENGHEYKKRTIGQLTSSGDDSLFNTLTISTLMDVDHTSDSIMRSFAFGNEGTHYERVDSDGDGVIDSIKMMPKKYFLGSDGKLYDEEHYYIATLGDEVATGIYQFTTSDNKTQYVKATSSGGYYVYKTIDDAQTETHKLYHEKTALSDLRGAKAAIIIERIELSSALGIDIFAQNGQASMMASLAFGNEGKHYELVDTNSDGIKDKIEWKTDPATGLKYHARTLGDLKGNNAQTLINEVELGSALGINPLASGQSALMISLAYGSEGKHYELVDTNSDGKNDKIVWNVNPETGEKYHARTLGDLINNSQALIDEVELGAALGIDPLSTSGQSALMISLAYGNEGTHYELVDTNSDGKNDKIVWNVNPETGEKYCARTLGDLITNSQSLINDVELASALGIDIFAKNGSALMISLAYGNEGKHYELVDTNSDGKNDKIEWKTNLETGEKYCARTLGDLINNSQSLINDVEMRSLFTPPEGKSHGSIMNYLLYNEVDANPENPEYKVRTLGDFMENSNEIISKLSIQKMVGNEIYNMKQLSSTKNANGCYDEVSTGTATLCNPVYQGNTLLGYLPVIRKTVIVPTEKGDKTYFKYTYENGDVAEAPLVGCWKYLLVDPNQGMELETSMDSIGDMISNVTTNMQSKSLNELQNDGMITLDASTLETKVAYEVKLAMNLPVIGPYEHTINVRGPFYHTDGTTVKETLGELTISETLEYISILISKLSNPTA